MSLVKKCYLTDSCIDYGNKADIECVHGDQNPYPTSEVTIAIDGQAFLLQVSVIENLSFDCILASGTHSSIGWLSRAAENLLEVGVNTGYNV